MKRTLSYILVFVLALTLMGPANTSVIYAKAKKAKLNKKSVQLYVGKTQKIKLKNPSKKVKWKVANKKIVKIVKKYGKKKNTIKIKGLKAGKTKITAKVGKKKYVLRVTVKKRGFTGKQPPTTAVVTTPEITTIPTETTVIETTAAETTTVESTATETTTVESTTEEISTADPNISADYSITASVENDMFEIGEDLVVTYTVNSPDESTITTYDDSLGDLVYYFAGVWYRYSPNKESQDVQITNGTITGSGSFQVTIPVSDYYSNLTSGRYIYTKQINGIDIEVEFYMYHRNNNVQATVVKNPINLDETLKIQYSFVDENVADEGQYALYPGLLQIYENNQWSNMKQTLTWGVEEMVCYISEGPLSRDLDYFYQDIRVGHYRYWHKIDNTLVPVEFDIVDTSEPTTPGEPGKLVAKLIDDTLVENQWPEITFSMDAPTDLVLGIDENPYKLEIFKDGQWVQLPKTDTYRGIAGIYGLSWNDSLTLSIPITAAFGNLEIGHYRYTHYVLEHYTNTSDQEYPSTISVEFYVVPNEDGLNIVASVKNSEVRVGNDLELEINVLANNNDIPITFSKTTIGLRKYSYSLDFWTFYIEDFPESADDEITLNKLGSTTITIPINDYYGELTPGRYCCDLEVNGIPLFAEFDVIE